jgi:hypothetical protein
VALAIAAEDPVEDEEILLEGPPPEPSVYDLLQTQESETFEAKGSAFAALEPWLTREVDAGDQEKLKEEKGFFLDTVAKSVAAMLNTQGGIVMIGALEKGDKIMQMEDDRLRLRLNGFETGGDYVFVGLQDPTFQSKGCDGFALKLNRMLKEAIAAEISGLVRVYPDHYKGRPLALVKVEYEGIGGGFDLIKGGHSHFYVRRGPSNDELHGSEISTYMERKRRQDAKRGLA